MSNTDDGEGDVITYYTHSAPRNNSYYPTSVLSRHSKYNSVTDHHTTDTVAFSITKEDAVCNFDGVIVKAYRQQRPDKTINLDLPVFFVYNLEDNEWVLVKGPTSKYYDKEVYAHVERQAEEADPCVK